MHRGWWTLRGMDPFPSPDASPRSGPPPAGAPPPLVAPGLVAPGLVAPGLAVPVLRGALLESRQRWRDFTALATDLAFETDAAGRLTFLTPDPALGWPQGALLGQPVNGLLVHPEPDPFRPRSGNLLGGGRGVQAWLRQADGVPACYSLAVVPLVDAEGRPAGLRGIGRDVTAEVREADAQAAALRRAQALETLVRRVRRQVLAPQMLAAALESLPPALGCAGAAVLEMTPSGLPQVTHRHGDDPGPLLEAVSTLLNDDVPSYAEGPGREMLALLPHPQRRVPRYALLAWRAPGGRPFDADDRHLLTSAADLLFVALGNQALQQELELRARTDGLTGLLNRRAFLEDLHRRLERMDMDPPRAVGAVLFVDLDNFKPLNDRMGHEAGDQALIAVGRLLRDIVR
ncbi:MAG: diguanylate cyclase, partial [Acetobacteraceae bacterium]